MRGRTRSDLVTALVVLLLIGVVALVPPRKPQAPIDVRARLHRFLEDGPGEGLWQLHTLDGTSEWLVAASPDDATCLLVARLDEDGRPGRARVWEKHRLARFFLPGDLELFFRNYRLLEQTVVDEGSRNRIVAVWLPRADLGGDTGRTLWLDARSGEVVRLEDRSYMGNCLRCLLRLSTDAPSLGLALPDAEGACHRLPAEEGPPSAARLARRVPFVLLEPTWLPEGYELIAARYREMPVGTPEPGAGDESAPRCVGLATLEYSDGLANVGIGVAPPDDMDAFERWMASLPLPDDPEACPPVPEAGRDIARDGEVIRRRRDRCRTVLRLDGRGDVSVLLLGRNEIPEDEYLHILASVAPVQASPAHPGD